MNVADFNNVLTMGLCSFGLVAGVIQRFTHRYKALQIFGICVKIIGYGLLVDKNGVHDVGRLVMSQLLTVSRRNFPSARGADEFSKPEGEKVELTHATPLANRVWAAHSRSSAVRSGRRLRFRTRTSPS